MVLLDVHFIFTLPVLVTSGHSREACPVLIRERESREQEPWGLDACFRRHDVYWRRTYETDV